MIIDATDLTAGRLASFAAKQALLGERVEIVNCEKAVISGTTKDVLAKYKRKMRMGTYAKGPFLPKMPDRFVKRIVRGMLPYKQEKGANAFKRITCYIGIPEKLRNEKLQTVEKANLSKLPNIKYVRVLMVCKGLGAKL